MATLPYFGLELSALLALDSAGLILLPELPLINGGLLELLSRVEPAFGLLLLLKGGRVGPGGLCERPGGWLEGRAALKPMLGRGPVGMWGAGGRLL